MPTANKIRITTVARPEDKKTDPFYLSGPWKRLRKKKVQLNPFCEYCELESPARVTVAKYVDHYLPRAVFPELELTMTNLMSCCPDHHNRKRRIESLSKDREVIPRLLIKHGFFRK